MRACTVHSVGAIDSNAFFLICSGIGGRAHAGGPRIVSRDGRHLSIKERRLDWLSVGVACPRTGIRARKAEKVTQYGVKA